jgi:L-fuconolactonase
MKIDAHQHFWQYDAERDAWITDEMQALRRNFMPEDLYPILRQQLFDGCVAVQADQSEHETLFLLELADKFDFIKGVVGWVDFCAANIGERLEYFSSFPKLKGFRHLVQAEPQDDFLLRKDFSRGIALLQQYEFTYDLLIHPRHLKYAAEFVRRFPNQSFVIDHLAKPFIKEGIFEEWKQDMQAIAQLPNTHCKLSGMVTEADWSNWKEEDFTVYIETVLESFGPDRVQFGSDWPVCLLSTDYANVCKLVEHHTASLSRDEKEKLWGRNAEQFYHLTD